MRCLRASAAKNQKNHGKVESWGRRNSLILTFLQSIYILGGS